MIFEDKLAIALALWGVPLAWFGGAYWSIYENVNGKRAALLGCICLVLASFVWVFS